MKQTLIDFQSQLLAFQKWSESFRFFFIEQNYFRTIWFVIDIFWQVQFLKPCFFENDAQFLTTRHYICLFLGKNISNFVSLSWKLLNPYCHSWCWSKNSFISVTPPGNFDWKGTKMSLFPQVRPFGLVSGSFTNYVDKFLGLFWPPTTDLPPLTRIKEFLYHFYGKSAYCWHFQYYLPTSSFHRSFWMTP